MEKEGSWEAHSRFGDFMQKGRLEGGSNPQMALDVQKLNRYKLNKG